MASTIIIKNGTSGAPGVAAMSQGELAINVANGQLFYGTVGGTAVSSSFTFSDITASGDIKATNINGTRLYENGSAVSTIYAPIAGSENQETVGALANGSITAGFGNIDNGTSGIRSNNITAETSFLPDANDGATLGTTDLQFSDLFLAEGGVINFDNGDVTITQTGNDLDIAGTENTSFAGHITASLNISGSGTGSFTAGVIGRNLYRSYYRFMGFNVANTADTVYEYSAVMQDTKAPWEHDQDHHATITTAMDVSDYFSAGGHIMPHGGTITKIRGWAHTNGTSAEHKLALVRLRPTEDDNSDVNPVLIDEITWTSLGNDKLKSINETLSVAVNAGDMLMTMIKDNTGGRTIYFNITVELSSDS